MRFSKINLKDQFMTKQIFKLSVASILAFSIAGCMTNPNISKDLSSGQIGCSPSDITIENETASMGGTHTWTAICKGEQYICNYHTTTGTKCTPKK